MRRLHVLALIALTAVGVLASAGGASAAPGDPFQYQSSFPGVDNPVGVVVNHASGNVLVFQQGQIKQFDSTGKPADFAALGSPTIAVGGGMDMAIDNTGGATQGNIYVFEFAGCCGGVSGNLWSFAADGSTLGTSPNSLPSGLDFHGLGVLPDGTLRSVAFDNFVTGQNVWVPTDEVGQPVGPNGLLPLNGQFGPFTFDELGNYYAPGGSTFRKYAGATDFADLGETGLPVGSSVASDPSTNDLYTRQGTKILGVHYSDPLVESGPFEALDGIAATNDAFGFDGSGQTLYVAEGNRVSVFHRQPNSVPHGLGVEVTGVHSSSAGLNGQFSAGGVQASYHFEYGADASYGNSSPEVTLPLGLFPAKPSLQLEGLRPGTTYHARLVATNALGTTYGPDRVFKTYPTPTGADPCPNALARKQTLAASLLDCRAYELVSAADTGGYDVESYLVPGQAPFGGYPLAMNPTRVLYATHSGAVPGPWNPTNKGPDPYVATRGESGWSTQYVGLPANINPQAGGFSSVLGEADSSFESFAFAGSGLCSPCFGSGLETGIPVRLPNGRLVQGMSGSLAGSVPASGKPEGKVAKYFSADGSHLVFASKYAFEPGANGGGDLTVYDRNLSTGVTQIVSTDAGGNPLTGTVSELGISADGSRILTAKQVSADSQGNEYVHPYLHLGNSPNGVDLAPGTTSGVLYAGISADGSKVFFSTADKLVGDDTDTSADLYEAAVDGSGSLDLSVLTDSDSDACNAVANSNGPHWNSTGAAANCGAVAIAGGGGVASASGAVYFLSPESLGGEGSLNQPNLYLAQPGDSPSFVATVEPDNPLVLDSVKANGTRRTGDFQVTPSGGYAVFTSTLPLTGTTNFGLLSVFRYATAGKQLSCSSCDGSGTAEEGLASDAQLAPNGLSLTDDGRVFFTTRVPLVLTDTGQRRDVYEWSGGEAQLISSGISPFDSGLLSASADGTDVYFFTHDTLATGEDRNGTLTKIYDARAYGGFFKLPGGVPCAASDECHGPGTVTPPPPDIKSSGKTTAGNVLVCPKNRVKRRGQCVKKAQPRKTKAKKHAKKRNTKTTGKRGGRNA